jgi:hypothetical protein
VHLGDELGVGGGAELRGGRVGRDVGVEEEVAYFGLDPGGGSCDRREVVRVVCIVEVNPLDDGQARQPS